MRVQLGRPVTRALLAAPVVAVSLALGCALAPPAAAGSCPNEALRAETHSTALPECRAYELVSPPFKEGWPASFNAVAEAPEGGVRVNFVSFGAFAGTPADAVTASYLSTRGPGGWTTSPLEVPASLYNFPLLQGWSSDLSRSLWILPLHPPGPVSRHREQKEFGYYRREADGSFVAVGPLLSPASSGEPIKGYNSVSSELSTVVFAIRPLPGALWPGDETETEANPSSRWLSLYEYAGVGNSEPALVGVRNEGTLHGSPARNDGAELVSDCGTELGGLQTKHASRYNAISASGAYVYFTAEHWEGCKARQPAVNELYVRVGGEKTLAISEPPLEGPDAVPDRQCTGVCESDEKEETHRSEGIFAGASEDGRKVFFLTKQPLVNADKDTTQDLYMAEIAGEGRAAHVSRLVLVSEGDETDPHRGEGAEVQGVARISENGERVYFVAKGVLTTSPDHSLAGRQSATAGADNLYVYDTATGKLGFVATLSSADGGSSCGAEAEAQESACDWSLADHRTVQASEDGEYLIFLSSADLTADDTSTGVQLFEYDAASERLVRASIGEEGFNDNGNVAGSAGAPIIRAPVYDERVAPTAADQSRNLARDGAVFFESADGLVPGALDRVVVGLNAEGKPVYARNVYEYREGHIYLISKPDTGELAGESTVTLQGVTPSGNDVIFQTADALVAQDTDTQVDIYDARVDGGFPAPAAGGCGEGDCREALAPPSPLPLAGGSETVAPGDEAIASGASGAASKPGAPTRAQQLKQALKACRKARRKRPRRACERRARKRYAAKRAARRTRRARGRRRRRR